jgi:hypothetical protein
MGRTLRSLLIASSAAVIALGFGSSTAPASEAPCGPTDVVPNPVPQPSWKGGPVEVTNCGQPVVAEPAVLPRERVDTPQNVGVQPQGPSAIPTEKATAAKRATAAKKAKKAKAKKAKARKAKRAKCAARR